MTQMYAICEGVGTKRRYFKTVNVDAVTKTFSQPTLSSEGTMGGGSFAVSASANSDGNGVYSVFDSSTSTYWRSGTSSEWIQFYNPNRLKVTRIKWGYFYSYPKSGTVQGSANGSSWTTLKSWTNSSASDFTITLSTTGFYKYYRINISSVNRDVIHCANLAITATEEVTAAYSYEVEVSSTDSYDRYIDEKVINLYLPKDGAGLYGVIC